MRVGIDPHPPIDSACLPARAERAGMRCRSPRGPVGVDAHPHGQPLDLERGRRKPSHDDLRDLAPVTLGQRRQRAPDLRLQRAPAGLGVDRYRERAAPHDPPANDHGELRVGRFQPEDDPAARGIARHERADCGWRRPPAAAPGRRPGGARGSAPGFVARRLRAGHEAVARRRWTGSRLRRAPRLEGTGDGAPARTPPSGGDPRQGWPAAPPPWRPPRGAGDPLAHAGPGHRPPGADAGSNPRRPRRRGR